MKTKTTLLTSLILLASILCFTIGCDEDDEDEITNSNVNNLFGTWVESSVTMNGAAADLAEVLEWEEGVVKGTVALNADYTYEANNYNAADSALYTESGTFRIDNNWIIMTATSENDSTITPEQVFNGQWSTDGSTMSLTQTVGNDTMVLGLTKES